MSKITLVLGGARSGKSTRAEKIASEYPSVLYIATTKPNEAGMEERIRIHRARRPKHWKTLEEYKFKGKKLQDIRVEGENLEELHPQAILLDCATLMSSNLLFEIEQQGEKVEDLTEKQIFDAVVEDFNALLSLADQLNAHLILVSNEVGMGLVSDYKLGNIYRDLAGNINKYLASKATEVLMVVAGLDLKLK